MTVPYRWTGTIRRGAAPGTVIGVMRNGFGSQINLTGTHIADAIYDMVGTMEPMPAEDRIPWLDDDPI